MKFSKTTGCFYPDDIHYENPPADLIEVAQDDYTAAMNRAPGETLDVAKGKLVIVPALAPDPAVVKANKWNAIKTERDRRIQQGGYKVGAKWYHSDTFSRTQQMGLVMLGANIQANLQWKTMDGSFVTMTQQLAGQVLAAAAASDQAIFAAAEAHRQAMEASADPAAYDFSTGWPKVFGE